MFEGKVAELPTGEGKTLAAVFPAYAFALSGRGVHVLTFNDYLARRDAGWMGPVFRLLGLSVGFVQEKMDRASKRAAYACDVTYATAKEAGFDFLRDGLAFEEAELVNRPFHAAIVDEADSILIDEARIPLVISGAAGELNTHAGRLALLVRSLTPGVDFETDEENRNVFATDAGLAKIEATLGRGNLYDPRNEGLLAAVHCALHAEALLRRDVDYIVRDGRVEIVDEFTGRVMDKRHWPDGLQAAVEAKEGVLRKSEGRILGSITLQHFFGQYPRLAGMTATAETAARELEEFYGVGVVVVPPHRPCVRIDHPDMVFTHEEAKREALVREIMEVHRAGRPVLVGTLSVRESEELASALRGAGVDCEVLNAKNDELEAKIVADAGLPGTVTISTNLAGRGTDIRLGGQNEEEKDRVAALGGLYVIGTNRHESLRVDRQLRGRAGRQGDPGSSRFFISLEDDIFERYGLGKKLVARHRLEAARESVGGRLLLRDIVHAQRVIEGQNFDIRKSLHKYSSLVETQRKIVERWRRSTFQADPAGDRPAWISAALRKKGKARFGPSDFARIERRAALFHLDRLWADHLAAISDLRESVHLFSIGGREPLQEFQKSATNAFLGLEKKIRREIARTLRTLVSREGPVDLDAEGLRGPSSTWTYLVNDDQAEWGVELMKGKNIGFAAVAASPVAAPFLFLALVARRLKKSRRSRGKSETA
jgi:preprotein translocase subunit SecA